MSYYTKNVNDKKKKIYNIKQRLRLIQFRCLWTHLGLGGTHSECRWIILFS